MRPTIALISFLSLQVCWGQSRTEILKDISNKYQVIRELVNSNALRQFHTDYVCEESSEKGELTFYYNSSELKHILHIYSQGLVTYKDEYYVWDERLFFQFATHKIVYKDYKRNKFGKLRKIDVALHLEERFYFHNEEPIKCQFKDFETRSNNRKNPRTNYVRNQTVNCDQADKVLEKFYAILEQQELNLANACDLPRSISNSLDNKVMYGGKGVH